MALFNNLSLIWKTCANASLVAILGYLAAVIGAGRVLRRVWATDPAPTEAQIETAAAQTKPQESAFLRDGVTGLQVHLAEELYRAGFLKVEGGRLSAKQIPEGTTPPEDPLTAEMLKVISQGLETGIAVASDQFVSNMSHHRAQELAEDLRAKGLWSSEKTNEKAYFLRFVAICAMAIPAGIHLMGNPAYGAIEDHLENAGVPLEFYSASMLIGVMFYAMFILLADPKAAPLGKAVLRKLLKDARGDDSPALSELRASFRKSTREQFEDMAD